MSSLKCPICGLASTSHCSNCLKVVYCSKNHQKVDRKKHKKDCFPAQIKSDPVLGEHLASSRDIKEEEVIFHEEPLIIGPRSNLPEFCRICLGCYSPVSGEYTCSKCSWPLCGVECEAKYWHAKFECEILARNKVAPARTQNEYLHITFLRGVLLKNLDPERWLLLSKFESHANSRDTVSLTIKQSQNAFKFITETCGLKEFSREVIDFVYGIILVNGYGEAASFAVKLYSKAGKISHACIPNTRTRVLPSGLDVIAAVGIPSGSPLTQLYGRMLKGTHRRQELLQHVYYFSCSCQRCQDPTECSTYFSALKCSKCSGNILPIDPLLLDMDSKWECDNCKELTTFSTSVVPALGTIFRETGMQEDTPLFTEYDFYVGEDITTDQETIAIAQLQFILQTCEKLEQLTKLVHKNHYALLPIKTACIATCHSLLQNLGKFDIIMFGKILQMYRALTEDVYKVVDIFLPGCTSERGVLLFHLAEGLRLSKDSTGLKELRESCLKIMRLEPEGDPHKQMALNFLEK